MNMLKLFTKLQHATLPAVFFLLLLATGCSQDPIFDYIFGETAPTTAKIKGSPSKIVSVGGKLYLANGRLWEYPSTTPDSSWNPGAGPEGYVVDVASASNTLYALTLDNITTKVWQKSGSGWTELGLPGGYNFIQNIFGAGDALFATGAKKVGDDYDYAILYKNTSDQLVFLKATGTAYLTGAGKVGSNYYLASWGQGIYTASGTDPVSMVESSPSGPTDVAGLLQADSNLIIGISKGGLLLYIDASIMPESTTLGGGPYSGALALMDSPAPQGNYNQLLLLGIKTQSSYTHGYMELRFNSATKTHLSPQYPGQNQPSSIKDNGDINAYQQYESSLRRYPVTALWVLPKSGQDPQVIFAATSNQGLYSYRSRSGGWQWNHEE
jgi:hypothetical protein